MRRNWHKDKYRPASQVCLAVSKTFGQINEENTLREDIENLELELKQIDHLRNCERCMVEAVLGIERYMGSRLPWYLNLINGVDLDGCPQPEDYEIGWYGNDNLPGTTLFIKDRLKWAKQHMEQELQDRQRDLSEVSKTRLF